MSPSLPTPFIKYSPMAKFGLSLLIASFLTSWSWAQDKSRFAVVDYAVLFKDYHKAAEAKLRFEKKQDEFKKEMEERMTAVTQLIKDAKKLQEDMQSPVLSEAKKKEIAGQLREKQMELEGRQKIALEYRDQALGLMQKNQMAENEVILAEMNKAVATVSRNKYTIVFAKPQVSPTPGGVTFSEGLDEITPQVLAVLNSDAPAPAKKEEKK